MTAVLRQSPLPPPRTSSLQNQKQGGDRLHASSLNCKMNMELHETCLGDYILGQTLGEGEFGKVKLGWPRRGLMQLPNGQVRPDVQVAIKLIRKDSINGSRTRLNKIRREVSILRYVCHPNIVKLFDVIETTQYIGIILEYASGGELFDFILVHRYLKDNIASKLFAQLISGVSYLHKKGIVHRDLKLENLLLDRNKNIIVTDFGFANVFDVGDNLNNFHDIDGVSERSFKRGDLMQTSCGSPCYAAPELVIGDGCYVGRKVDVWSCGVILYAMLAGYLPFDDDPNNPDGDNINLLYKYIINTPLTFPEYVSVLARDLLKRLLVPDPKRRASLQDITTHPWLIHHIDLFNMPFNLPETSAFNASNEKRHVSSNIISQSKAPFKLNREKYNGYNDYSSPCSGYMSKGQQASSASNNHKRHTVHIDYESHIQNYSPSFLSEEMPYSKYTSINDNFNDMMSSLNISLSENTLSHDTNYNSALTLTAVSENNKTSASIKGPTKVSAVSQLNKLPAPPKKPRPTSYQSPVGIFEGSSLNLFNSLNTNARNKQFKRNTVYIPTSNSTSSKPPFLYEKGDLYVTRAPPSLLPIPAVSKNAELSRPPSPLKYTSNVTLGTSMGMLPTDDKYVPKKVSNTHKRGSNSISIGAERLFGKIWNGNLNHSLFTVSTNKNYKNTPCTSHMDLLTHNELDSTKLNAKKTSKISKTKKIFANCTSEKNNTSRVMSWFTKKRKNKDVL
ncbi:hypothetical protein T552_00662 [Pneumocystis carinii B80]|uniref:Protein kinase domain-containing protein n=1 Tax=Pneumocystis carinii (strain B80) TaxID=1408658 RepID=A0A0W4ZP63_PNEC8|nr:hypothetical protein T552_00662 [Pneumocystis carinii B80]KTW30183.1 hypothetical protein T552_00662 [Pneumocystis carinii B80]